MRVATRPSIHQSHERQAIVARHPIRCGNPLQNALEVSAVAGLSKDVAEYLAAVEAVMLELVCHPGVRAAHARERVKLEAGVNVEIVKVDGRLERHLVCGELLWS